MKRNAALAPGFRPLSMQLRNDCGPTALLQALEAYGRPLDRDELLRLWRFREGADRLDTPGHHLRILRRLGIPAAMRRRLARREVARAVRAGRPVVLLVPVGTFRWHWVVVCGVEGDGAVVSRGDGELVTASWSGLVATRPRGPSHGGAVDGPPSALVSPTAGAGLAGTPSSSCRLTGGRALRVDGLGYCLGRPFPFAPDRALERDMLRLASFAEEALAVTEPALRAARAVLERLARLAGLARP